MQAPQNKQLEDAIMQGKSEFKMSINGLDYQILLDPDRTTGKQQNMNTGRPRRIRLWPPPEASNEAFTNERMSPAQSSTRPLGPPPTGSLPPPTGSLIGVIPTTPGKLPEAEVSRLRISVWLSGDWHPISEAQDRQIKEALTAGKTIFEITDKSFRFTIDTTGKSGWVQIGAKRTRKMKVELAAEQALVRQPSKGGLSMVETIKKEWKHVAGGKPKITRQEMVSSWSGACKDAGVQDVELLEQTALDIFNRIDVSRNGYIEEYEWVHYKLLELQAPSFHSLAQVNEKVLQWEKERRGVCADLLQVFVKNGGDDADARIAATAMKKIAKEWSQSKLSAAKPPSKKVAGGLPQEKIGDVSRRYLEELLQGMPALEEDLPITYYDFMNHMLGRRKATVSLYKYDLSNGKAWWLSPLLLGQHFEGIWHTGIVVHGKEYWFGGNIFESKPASTPFGEPTQIVELPEFTMRTREDLWNFISRELSSEFTRANYDVLTHNCNHFSDAVSVFLLSEHIPDDVLKQPEMVMNTITVQALRPLLNRWLGTFGDESADASGRKTDDSVAKDEWAMLEPATLVVYEYKPGWTCVARLVDKAGETCTLRRVNASSKALLIEEGVSRTMVSRLPTSAAKGSRMSSKGAGGLFGPCMQPSVR